MLPPARVVMPKWSTVALTKASQEMTRPCQVISSLTQLSQLWQLKLNTKVTMAVRRSDKLAIEEAWNDQHESSAHGLIGWQLNIQQVNKPTEEQQELQALSFIVKLMMNPFSLSEKERARL